jgi:signal transduction histidine kinase
MADDLRLGPASGGDALVRGQAGLAAALASILDIEPEERALRRLLSTVAEVLPTVDSAALVVASGDRLDIAAGLGLDEATPEVVTGGLAARIVASGAVERSAAGPPFPAGTRHAAGAPLAAGGTRGALVVGTRGDEPLDDDALLLLRVAGERAAFALERARLVRTADDSADTLRRAEADLESRRKALDYILGIVGHDLRNPLGAVHMSAALLHTKGGLSGWQARAIERTRSSAGRMGRIISDLLSYTRTRLGNGIPIARRPASLDAIARKVVDELSAVNSGREIVVDVAGDVTGEWDPDRLEQVASNLVSNAIDHGDGGPVWVEVAGGDPEAAVLRVRNGGPSIPPEVLGHLFEPFARPPDEKSKKASGLGLGLYIAREIVRGHGGDIAASSEAETIVTVRLPRRPPA